VVCLFDASATTDPDGDIVSYGWSFGDGNTASGVSVSNTYLTPGTYAVTLTVTDAEGNSDTAIQNISI
jgi:PKD repeat protein